MNPDIFARAAAQSVLPPAPKHLPAEAPGDGFVTALEYFGHLADTDNDWVDEFLAWVVEHRPEREDLRLLCAELSWRARVLEHGPITMQGVRCRLVQSADPEALRALFLLHGGRLRYDFCFTQLARLAGGWQEAFPDEPIFVAMVGFGLIGTGRVEAGAREVEHAMDMPQAGITTRRLCLHAYWFADNLPDQADRILEVSEEMLRRNESDSNVCFRRAYAFRRRGEYDRAIVEVDRAMAMLAPGSQFTQIHQDYMRERTMIEGARQMTRLVEQTADKHVARLDKEMSERIELADQRFAAAQKTISDGLLKIVEILGLFITIVLFLVGGVRVFATSNSFGGEAASLAMVTGFALAFFTLLRIVATGQLPFRIRLRRRKKRKDKELEPQAAPASSAASSATAGTERYSPASSRSV